MEIETQPGAPPLQKRVARALGDLGACAHAIHNPSYAGSDLLNGLDLMILTGFHTRRRSPVSLRHA